MKKIVFFFLVTFSCLAYGNKTADLLYMGAGINNVHRPNSWSTDFFLQYKSHLSWYRFRPIVSISVTTKKQVYIAGGISLDFYPGKFFFIAPTFTPGYYYRGDGKDLGFPLEFRSGIELGIRFKNLARLGAHVSHTSNASISRKNPGLETLLFFFAYPLMVK